MQIVKMNKRHVIPAHATFAKVLEEMKISPTDKQVNKAKNEQMMIETSRMSFASMGCMLSSMSKGPCGDTINHHV